MLKRDARANIGGLSEPGKMPGKGYGLPAAECPRGKLLVNVPGSVCFKCYGLKGNYRFSNVVKAQRNRFEIITAAIAAGPNSEPWNRFRDSFVTLLESETFFRFHDTGDLSCANHLRLYCEIARAVPGCRFWIPTREKVLISRYPAAGIPDNLTIRLSADMLNTVSDRYPTNSATYDAPETAAAGSVCPAPNQGNSCGECRLCWDRDVPTVIYKTH